MGRAPLHHRPRGGDERGDPAAVRKPRSCARDPYDRGQALMQGALMSRPLVIAALFALAGCALHPQPALQKGAAWLWSRQEADGGWHSHTYGLLRSGQSLT